MLRYRYVMSRHISVLIATSCTAGVLFPTGVRSFSLLHSVQTASGTHQPPMEWVAGDFPLGLKRPRREAELHIVDLYLHSPTRLHGIVLNSLSTETTLCSILQIY
jgi:hypothetical protein